MKKGERRGNIWKKGDEEVIDAYKERWVSDRCCDYAVYLEARGGMILTVMEACKGGSRVCYGRGC
jgi:hypothetical protein